MELDSLIWDKFNSFHIKKHKVSKNEIYEACINQRVTLQAKNNRILLIGKTNKNRTLSIVLAKVNHNNYYLVTARDSSKKERKLI